MSRDNEPSDPMTYGAYFRDKQTKLDVQFEATRQTESNIFAGVLAAVDGFTEELTALEIRQILAKHGGTYAQYVWTPGITHLIASNLPTAKVRKELTVKRRTPLAIVTPKWIVDSLKARKQLPWSDYTLAQLHAPDQTTLNRWRGQTSSSILATCAQAQSPGIINPVVSEKANHLLPPLRVISFGEDIVVLATCWIKGINLSSVNFVVAVESNGETIVVGKSNSLEDPRLCIGQQIPQDLLAVSSEKSMEIEFGSQAPTQILGTDNYGHSDNNHKSIQLRDGARLLEYDVSNVEAFVEAIECALASTSKVNAWVFQYHGEILVETELTPDALRDELRARLGFDLIDVRTVTSENQWTRGTDITVVGDIACMPFELKAVLGHQTGLSDASSKLLELAGMTTKPGLLKWLRKVCSGQANRHLPLWASRGNVVDQSKNQDSLNERHVHAIVMLRENVEIIPESICDALLKRSLHRPISRVVLEPSSNSSLSISVFHGATGRTVTSLVSWESDLYKECLSLVRDVVGSLTTVKSVRDFIKLDIVRTEGVEPSSFSQISPSILKHLPRDVVRDLKLKFDEGEATSNALTKHFKPGARHRRDDSDSGWEEDGVSRQSVSSAIPGDAGNLMAANTAIRSMRTTRGGEEEDENVLMRVKPISTKDKILEMMPETLSQLDSSVLDQLPDDIRGEIERHLKTTVIRNSILGDLTQTPHVSKRTELANPTSASQIDPSVLAELPDDIKQSVERHFAHLKKESKPVQAVKFNLKRENERSYPKAERRKGVAEGEVNAQTIRSAHAKRKRRKVTPEVFDDVQLVGEEDMNSRSSFPDSYSQIDRNTLKELPHDIALQVEREFKERDMQRRATKSKKQSLESLCVKPTQYHVIDTDDSGDLEPPSQLLDRRSKAFAANETFASVRQTLTNWLDAFSECPHDSSMFEASTSSYMEALILSGALDQVVQTMSLLRRLCKTKECQGDHSYEAKDCWALAYRDLERNVQRVYRGKFNGASLMLTVT